VSIQFKLFITCVVLFALCSLFSPMSDRDSFFYDWLSIVAVFSLGGLVVSILWGAWAL